MIDHIVFDLFTVTFMSSSFSSLFAFSIHFCHSPLYCLYLLNTFCDAVILKMVSSLSNLFFIPLIVDHHEGKTQKKFFHENEFNKGDRFISALSFNRLLLDFHLLFSRYSHRFERQLLFSICEMSKL